jgi:uncharacterized RDD family membrane protein YckC
MSTAGFAYPASPMVEAASWARRFGAYFLDGLLLGIPFVGFMMARMMGVLAEAGLFEQSGPMSEAEMNRLLEGMYGDMYGEMVLIGLFTTLVTVVYDVVMHATLGRTVGKMACSIKVIKVDGTPCDWAAAAKRALVKPLAGGVPFIGTLISLLNGFWPLFDDKHQSLGDKLGGTYVVNK